ncbi:MAG: PAS domain S-box protein [Candidatus Bathyarchaeota archaeon]|jgi:PAS domain S-box-containing protein
MLESSTEQLQKKPVSSKPETLIRVLHVDDDADFLKCSKRILGVHDSFQIETALSVKEALQKLGQKSYDVIVSDHVMPEKNGLDLLKELRDKGNDIPFILFTGKGREEVAIEALNLGADQYVNKIGKPEVVYHELTHAIREMMKIRETEKALQKSEEKYRRLFENAPVVILTLDLKGNVTSVNKVAEEYGFKKDEIVGKNMRKFVFKRYLPKLLKDFAQLSRGKTVKGKFEIETPNGKKTARYKSNPIIIDNKVVGIQSVLTDITERKTAEEKLLESEEKFRNLAEKSPNMIFINKKGRVIYANKRCEEVMGYRRKEFYSPDFNFFTLIAPESVELLKSSYRRHLKGKEILPYEYTIITKDGKKIEAILTSKLIIYEGEQAILGIITDITKRKKAEEALKESEERFRQIAENAEEWIWEVDANGLYTYASPVVEKVLGYTPEELVGRKHFYDLFHPEDRKNLKKAALRVFDEKHSFSGFFNQCVHKNGNTVCLSTSGVPILDDEGNLLGYRGSDKDITEQKLAEEALRESEEKYRELLNGMNDTAWVIDFDGKIVDVNAAATKVLGYSREEFRSMGLTGIDSNLDPKEIKSLVSGMPADEVQVFETVHTTKDGKKIPVEISSSLVTYRGKRAILSIARDITERRKASEALRQSNERYRTVFENTGTAMCILEEDRTISMVNRQFEELSGYSWKELKGKKWTDFVTKDYLKRMKRYHEARRKKGRKAPKHYFFDFANKNGQIKNCMLTVNLIPGTKKTVNSILDITELKKVEKALLEAEKKYRKTILNANVGIINYSPKGKVKILNPKMEQMTGFTRSEIPTLKHWFEKLYPNKEERCKIEDRWFKRMSEEGEVKEGHAIITTKDGKRRNLLFNGVRLESGDSIAFAEDITERKEAEKKLDTVMNKLVTINEKLSVVGRLTRHDARNKLSVIANNVYLVKQKLPADHGALEFLHDVESAIDQMEKIFCFAKNYEMLGVEELSYMDVGKSVEEAAILLSGMNNVKVVNECKGLTVMADSLLRQLFYNLIDDTLKHGEKVSQIRVYHEEGENQLKLVYEDDGVGIPENEKELIFKEGYGKGTGYGLYLIKKMCEEYGWTIRETGKHGKGAQFTMTMPQTNKSGKASYRFGIK